MSILDVVVHLSFIEEVLTTKETTELNLSLKVFLLNVGMNLTDMIRDLTHILTNEDIRTGATLHLPQIRRHGEQIQCYKFIIIVNHSSQMQI